MLSKILRQTAIDGRAAFISPAYWADDGMERVWVTSVRCDRWLWSGSDTNYEVRIHEDTRGAWLTYRTEETPILSAHAIPEVQTPEELLAWLKAFVRMAQPNGPR